MIRLFFLVALTFVAACTNPNDLDEAPAYMGNFHLGHNVVVAPNVQGSVTISLRDVTWEQALKIIGQTYDLSVVFEKEGYIRVLPSPDYRKEQTELDKHICLSSSVCSFR